MFINKELKNLGMRVYTNTMEVKKDENGKVIYDDVADITTLVDKTFNNGSPTQEKLALFNEVVLRTAEVIAEPKIEQILNLFAKYDKVPEGAIKVIKLPKGKNRPHLIWSADGTGVDYVRLSAETTQTPAVAKSFSTGAYYELSDFSGNAVEAFRNVVDEVANALIQLYFDEVSKIVRSAVTAGTIPSRNCATGANLSLAEFKGAENTMIRLGNGQPVFIADSMLIEALQSQQVNAVSGKESLLTDELRKSLREDLYLEKVSKSIAVNLVNPFTSENNDEVAFPVNEGYIFPAGASKAIEITRFGESKQFTSFDDDSERVRIKIKMKNSIDLVNAREVGYVKDDSLSL